MNCLLCISDFFEGLKLINHLQINNICTPLNEVHSQKKELHLETPLSYFDVSTEA